MAAQRGEDDESKRKENQRSPFCPARQRSGAAEVISGMYFMAPAEFERRMMLQIDLTVAFTVDLDSRPAHVMIPFQ
jgi:hypothetical protein